MNIDPKGFVIIGIVTTATAQILLKISASQEVIRFKCLLFFALSLFSYSISFASYYFALKYFEISKVSPIMMASIVSLVALYGFAVGESYSHLKGIGIFLAIVSIFLISRS